MVKLLPSYPYYYRYPYPYDYDRIRLIDEYYLKEFLFSIQKMIKLFGLALQDGAEIQNLNHQMILAHKI